MFLNIAANKVVKICFWGTFLGDLRIFFDLFCFMVIFTKDLIEVVLARQAGPILVNRWPGRRPGDSRPAAWKTNCSKAAVIPVYPVNVIP